METDLNDPSDRFHKARSQYSLTLALVVRSPSWKTICPPSLRNDSLSLFFSSHYQLSSVIPNRSGPGHRWLFHT